MLGPSLLLSRLAPTDAALFRWVRPALTHAIRESPSAPPLFVLADVALLLSGRPLVVEGSDVDLDLRAYIDHFLGALALSSVRVALQDARARLPEDTRPLADALLTERILRRCKTRWRPPETTAEVRRFMTQGAAEAIGRAVDQLPDCASDLQDAVNELTVGARGCAHLLTPADVLLVENLSLLQTRSLRLAADQAVAAATELGRTLPVRVRRSSRGSGRLATRVQVESAFPAGGFSGVTQRGALQSLVTSELVYMDDGADIDLFDVRYVTNELLYYARDEGSLLRHRYTLHVCFDASLMDARRVAEGHHHQGTVAAMGLVKALLDGLVRWLGDTELALHLHVATGLDTEATVLTALFGDALAQGVAHIHRSDLSTLRSTHAPPLVIHLHHAAPVDPHPSVLPIDVATVESWPATVRALAEAVV